MKKFLTISLALLLLSATMLSSCSNNSEKHTPTNQEQSEEETAYLQAKAYLDEAKYQEAYDLFLTIKGYKNVDEHLDRFFYAYGKENHMWTSVYTYEYDTKGNFSKISTGYGEEKFEYEYTEDGVISSSKSLFFPYGHAKPSSTALFEYNHLGYITKIDYVEQNVTVFVEYNSNNQPVSGIVSWAGGDSYEFLWEYNTQGKLSKETYSERIGGTENSSVCVYSYENDKLGRVIRETKSYQNGPVSTVYYEYDAQSNLIKETHTNGTASEETTVQVNKYQYDKNRTMTQKETTDEKGNVSVFVYSEFQLYYHWDSAFETNEWIKKRLL